MLSVNFGINKLEILSLGIYLDLISTFGPYGSKLLQPATLLKVTHCGCFSRFHVAQMVPNRAKHLIYFQWDYSHG